MNESISWNKRVEDYLDYRRNLGFALANDEYALRRFAKYADDFALTDPLTTAVAVEWALSFSFKCANTLARRIEKMRAFAKYCKRFDPLTEVPPMGILGAPHRRLIPHIFDNEELIALLRSTNRLRPPNGLRPVTCRILFGLLATSGLRISEALGLRKNDVDLSVGLLTIREAKFQRERLVPIHASLTAQLQIYAEQRDRLARNPCTDHFFLFDDGRRPSRRALQDALRFLCKNLGWRPRGDHKHHRLHDFRHSFVVHSLLRFYQSGADVHRSVPVLTTYVGHAKFAHTYWYVTGIPDLMNIAAERFRAHAMEDDQ